MKVIVVGGCGFLGLYIAEQFARKGIKIVLLDSKERYIKTEPDIKNTFIEIKYPYGELAVIDSVIENGDILIHLGWSNVPNDNPISFQKDISENILNSAKIFYSGVQSKARKIIFASSGGAVYGNKNEIPINEKSDTSPISSYGIAKLTAEKYLELITSNSETKKVIFRIGNAYGTHMSTNINPTGLIPSLFKALQNNEEIEIWGDGTVTRDFIHVKDIATAFYLASENSEIEGVFNLGTGKGTSLLSLISLIENNLKKKLRIVWTGGRSCDVKSTILDTKNFKNVSGWTPKYNLELGIEEMLNEYNFYNI